MTYKEQHQSFEMDAKDVKEINENNTYNDIKPLKSKENVQKGTKTFSEMFDKVEDLADQINGMLKGVETLDQKISEIGDDMTVKRRLKIEKVLRRYSEIPLTKLAKILNFSDEKELENWLLKLPEDFPLKIDGDNAKISSNDLSADIDRLIASFDQWRSGEPDKKI